MLIKVPYPNFGMHLETRSHQQLRACKSLLLHVVKSYETSWKLNVVLKLLAISINVYLWKSLAIDASRTSYFTWKAQSSGPPTFFEFYNVCNADSLTILLGCLLYCLNLHSGKLQVDYIASLWSCLTFNMLLFILCCIVGNFDATYVLQEMAFAMFLCFKLVNPRDDWCFVLKYFENQKANLLFSAFSRLALLSRFTARGRHWFTEFFMDISSSLKDAI